MQRSFYATDEEMMLFHSPDYIEFMNKYFYLSAEKRKNPYCEPWKIYICFPKRSYGGIFHLF